MSGRQIEIKDVLKQRKAGISFEFFPPKTDKGKTALLDTLDVVNQFNPLYLSMTYGATGSEQEWTKTAVDLLLAQAKATVMPHLTCVGAKKEKVSQLLEGYHQQGIKNIMALRGDLPQDHRVRFVNTDFSYAVDLVSFIKRSFNYFSLGVAVYPEGHIENKSLKEDLEFTKMKIDAGADFVVTQMFFDNRYYYEMLERMKKIEIKIPLLPGIFPLTDIIKLKKFVSFVKTTIPKKIEQKMLAYLDSPEDMEKVGIDFTIQQCRDLMHNGVKQLHFFTFNKPNVIKKILEALTE